MKPISQVSYSNKDEKIEWLSQLRELIASSPLAIKQKESDLKKIDQHQDDLDLGEVCDHLQLQIDNTMDMFNVPSAIEQFYLDLEEIISS
jgi:hypothetical protein